MKVYAAVGHALWDSGVRTIFGLLGDGNMLPMAQYITRAGAAGRFIGSVDERGAVAMADGYARFSGEVGVASVTHGPGFTNTITSLVEAVRAGTPLVLLTADTPAKRNYPQAIDLGTVVAGTGAEYVRVRAPEHASPDVVQALARTAASRRPIVVDLPITLQHAETDYRAPSLVRPGAPPAAPDDATLDAALGAIASARRPVVLAGRGAVAAGARDELVALADALGAPLAVTARAKDFFRGHPYNLGLAGMVASPTALDVLSRADCVIAFGAGLNDYTTVDGWLLRDRRVVRVDADPTVVADNPDVTVAVVGDARLTAARMAELLRDAGIAPTSFRRDALGDGRPDLAEFPYRDRSTADTLDPRTAMRVLDEHLPHPRRVVVDAGRFMYAAWRHLGVDHPTDFSHSVAFASIGLAAATAIGAAAARPDGVVVGVAGDGGAMMGLIELSTAVRHRLPLVLVVLNDNCYGAEYRKFADHGFDPGLAMNAWPSLAGVATALGAEGVVVRDAETLAAAASRTATLAGPLLIEVMTDPSVDPRVP
jgi:acetolactate synthase-1/2/3 large subunit